MRAIAIKMLFGDTAKFYGILLGLAFATLLIAQQSSIFVGLMSRTYSLIEETPQADLWVTDPTMLFVDDTKPMQVTLGAAPKASPKPSDLSLSDLAEDIAKVVKGTAKSPKPVHKETVTIKEKAAPKPRPAKAASAPKKAEKPAKTIVKKAAPKPDKKDTVKGSKQAPKKSRAKPTFVAVDCITGIKYSKAGKVLYEVKWVGGDSTWEPEANIGNDDQFQIGARAEVPISNEVRLSQARRAVLQRVQRLATRDARAQTIRQEVLNAVDNLETAWQRILAARLATVFAARAYDAERRQFEVGLRTSIEVIDAAIGHVRLHEAVKATYAIRLVEENCHFERLFRRLCLAVHA